MVCKCANCEYGRINKDLDALYSKLLEETSELGMDIVKKIVELEIQAESCCNF